MANFCSFCGTRLVAGAQFCSSCGTKIAEVDATPPAVIETTPPDEPPAESVPPVFEIETSPEPVVEAPPVMPQIPTPEPAPQPPVMEPTPVFEEPALAPEAIVPPVMPQPPITEPAPVAEEPALAPEAIVPPVMPQPSVTEPTPVVEEPAPDPTPMAPPVMPQSPVIEQAPVFETKTGVVPPTPEAEREPVTVPTQPRPSKTSSKAPVIAILLVIVLIGGSVATWWFLKHKSENTVTSSTTISPSPNDLPVTSNPPDSGSNATDEVAHLRSEVGKIIGDVAAAQWSKEALDKAIPELDALIAKVKNAGRSDLALYWRALEEHLQCGRADRAGDMAAAKVALEKATSHIEEIGLDAPTMDDTMRGDMQSTIGELLGTAKKIKILDTDPLMTRLQTLKSKLDILNASKGAN